MTAASMCARSALSWTIRQLSAWSSTASCSGAQEQLSRRVGTRTEHQAQNGAAFRAAGLPSSSRLACLMRRARSFATAARQASCSPRPSPRRRAIARLLESLGITDFTWELGPGGNGASCRTADLLELAVLYCKAVERSDGAIIALLCSRRSKGSLRGVAESLPVGGAATAKRQTWRRPNEFHREFADPGISWSCRKRN